METHIQKERLLRMILKLKKKRKPKKVVPVMQIDNQPAVLFPENTNRTADYWKTSGEVQKALQNIVEKS